MSRKLNRPASRRLLKAEQLEGRTLMAADLLMVATGDTNNDGMDDIITEVGGWEGDGADQIGVFQQSSGRPIVGDWNGDGIDQIGAAANTPTPYSYKLKNVMVTSYNVQTSGADVGLTDIAIIGKVHDRVLRDLGADRVADQLDLDFV